MADEDMDTDLNNENQNVDDDSTARIAGLEKTIEGFSSIITTLANGQQALQQSLTNITESLAKGQERHDDDSVITPDDTELETLSRKDLISLINANTEKLLKKSLEGVSNDVKNLDGKLDNAISSVTVKDFQKDNPDLLEWKTEIAAIFQSGRTSTIHDAYKLARLDDPEKAKKLEMKYNPPSHKDDGKDRIVGFQGFPPSGGTTGTGNKRMTARQAAAAAWDEATAAVPGIDKFLSGDAAVLQ